MKKVLTFAFVVLSITVLLTFSAFAAETTSTSVTMNGQATINLTLMDDLSAVDSDKVLSDGVGSPLEYIDGPLGKALKSSTGGQTGVSAFNYNIQWDPDPAVDGDNVWQAYTGKVDENTKGFAFRVTVESESQTGFAFEPVLFINGNATQCYVNADSTIDIILIDADGTATVTSTQTSPWNREVILLPEDFDGWVIIPLGRLKGINDTPASVAGSVTGIWHTAFFFEQYAASVIATVTVHDMYTIAEAIPEVPEINEGPEPSGDVSVILYAAAALAAGGAFIALKKRRV